MLHCRYQGAARGPRFDEWREEFGRRWLSADLEPVEENYLANEFTATEHSFLALCNMQGTPVHTTRRNDVVARDYMYFIVASGSRVETLQRGRACGLAVGQMALMSADEPARVTQTMRGDRWSIRIPRRLVGDLCRTFDDKVARPLTVSGELAGLLLRQMRTAHLFSGGLDPAANHAVARHILDLVGLCLGADRDAAHVARRRGLAAARLDAIKADILRDLARPELGLAAVAARHRLRPRYVQRLFEQAGMSFTAFVLEGRLALAHRLLHDPDGRCGKVSDVALAAGFSDLSYFHRAFRTRFGATPREIRAASLLGAAVD